MTPIIRQYSPDLETQADQLFLELQKYEKQFDDRKSLQLENAQLYRKELIETIKNQSGEILIATVDNQVAGLIAWYLENNPQYDVAHGYISDIIVSEKHRGSGIGRQLVNEAISHIKNTGVTYIHIGVLSTSKRTKSFYKSLGFSDYVSEMSLKID